MKVIKGVIIIKKILITILVVIVILVGGAYYMLIPQKKVSINEDAKVITTEELLKGNFIESFEILKNPIRLEGSLAVSSNEFKDIIYTIMTKYNIEELRYSNIYLNDNFIKVIMPYKLLNFIDTQLEMKIYPTIIDNNLYLKLKDFKIGKIKVNDSIVESILETNANNLPFVVEKNVIIVDKSYTGPIKIENIKVKEDKIIVDIIVSATDAIEYIVNYNTN